MARISDAEEARLWAEKQRKLAAKSKERNADREITGEVADLLEHTADLGEVNTSETTATSGRASRFSRRRVPTSKGKQWLADVKARQERGEL